MISRPRARLGIDARVTSHMSAGMRRYVRELARALPAVAPEFEYVTFTHGDNFGWSEQVELPLAIGRTRVTLVHFLAHYLPVVVPARFIVTVHDLIHLRFARQFKRHVGPYYRTVVRHACARAARVITDDERTVEDLQRFLGVDPKKVRVIPLGTSPSEATGVEGPSPVIPSVGSEATGVEGPPRERPYFLCVGNHRAHKNLQMLLDAWQSLPESCDVDVCFTGADDFGGALQRASQGRRRAGVLGDLSDDDLTRWYRGAVALVHPALREGFGLPLLEAMAAGTPVLASDEAAPGVLRKAALLFPAGDVRMLADRLREIASDEGLRTSLVNEGLMLAKRLTWNRCARETAAVYHEVLG